jgi:2-polyprenyl-6-methoxyphenol hydroxylase-like FAD-dependent oxidoreductase
MEHLARQPTAEIRWSHKVLPTIGQDEPSAWVMVQTPNGERKFSADYIVGCDGANSQIRRSLFGNGDFPGMTWDEQIVATNVSQASLVEIYSISLMAPGVL